MSLNQFAFFITSLALSLAIPTVVHANTVCAQVVAPEASNAEITEKLESVAADKVMVQADQLKNQIQALLAQSHERRVDTEISELMISHVMPILEKNGQLMRSKAETTAEIVKTGLSNKLLALSKKTEGSLLKLAQLTANNKSFKTKLLALIPPFNNSRVERTTKIFTLRHREVLDLVKQIQKENEVLVKFDQSLRKELEEMNQAVTALQEIRDQVQNNLWEIEKNSSAGTQVKEYKSTLQILDKQIASLNEVLAVTQALQTQLNSQMDWNRTTIEGALDVVGRQANLVAAVADRKLDLSPAVEEAKPTEKTKPIEEPNAEPANLKEETKQTIANAKLAYYAESRDQILSDYFQRYSQSLSADEVLALATTAYYADNRDAILARSHYLNLTIKELIKIARACYYAENRDSILLIFAKQNTHRLTPNDLQALSKVVYYGETRDTILKLTLSLSSMQK